MWETISGAFLGLLLAIPVSWYFYWRETRDSEQSHTQIKDYFDNLIAVMETAGVARVVRNDAGRITELSVLRSMPQVEGSTTTTEQQQSALEERARQLEHVARLLKGMEHALEEHERILDQVPDRSQISPEERVSPVSLDERKFLSEVLSEDMAQPSNRVETHRKTDGAFRLLQVPQKEEEISLRPPPPGLQ
jgi:hypothetical protein